MKIRRRPGQRHNPLRISPGRAAFSAFSLFSLILTHLSPGPWLPGVLASERGRDKADWILLAGYGTSHPGMGATKLRIQTVDLVPRYERNLTANPGSSWYRGEHSLLLELPLHLAVSPDSTLMAGINFLACWRFTAHDRLQPYLLAGGGPLYMASNLEGMGTRLNGNYQFGIGLRRPMGHHRYLNLEYRFHHVSNGNRKEPNDPLNSSKFLLGVTF
ncbi:MAG TPA: acyloxyacyl hydrolase [Desulfurivibrio alkaliphilus]|uniref:Acyloxyacyl hydrolase n=1 Tax=Desulfurivibrio alkaliphilus TaxID=427923 RepID=A0A7C2XRQ2_9BACT|nr:acyloxyacyl hydrolase [Desulfurivibrio alkaliphilus]